jgi:hypothetical protein
LSTPLIEGTETVSDSVCPTCLGGIVRWLLPPGGQQNPHFIPVGPVLIDIFPDSAGLAESIEIAPVIEGVGEIDVGIGE